MAVTFNRERASGSAELLRDKRRELCDLDVPPGRGWEPLHQAMGECLADHPVGIAGVIAKLATIQTLLDDLPPSRANNRVAAFNDLYLTITRRVDGALGTTATDPDFLELLDIEFAKRYFDALRRWNDDDEATPDVWEVLFKRAQDQEMSQLIAAMLGVNAHINHDLSLALVATWNETGAPQDDRVHQDYLLVNKIFYEEIPPLRRSFSTDWQLALDGFVGGLDDWSQRILVTVTRARAWEQARELWLVRNDPDDFEQARLTMDRASSVLAEGVIVADRLVSAFGELADDGQDFLSRLLARQRERAGSGIGPARIRNGRVGSTPARRA
ncbi:MAG TPA: DUF5995 family protein [Actinoplanes sp.]|nr:DUF5995 family protein [Actinoplanes sp.]